MQHDIGLGFMGFGWFIVVFFIGIIIYFVLKESKQRQSQNNISALDILKKRYASGEITETEFNKVKSNLK